MHKSLLEAPPPRMKTWAPTGNFAEYLTAVAKLDKSKSTFVSIQPYFEGKRVNVPRIEQHADYRTLGKMLSYCEPTTIAELAHVKYDEVHIYFCQTCESPNGVWYRGFFAPQ